MLGNIRKNVLRLTTLKLSDERGRSQTWLSLVAPLAPARSLQRRVRRFPTPCLRLLFHVGVYQTTEFPNDIFRRLPAFLKRRFVQFYTLF